MARNSGYEVYPGIDRVPFDLPTEGPAMTGETYASALAGIRDHVAVTEPRFLGYEANVDGALGAAFAPYLEGTEVRLPAFDFRTGISSLSTGDGRRDVVEASHIFIMDHVQESLVDQLVADVRAAGPDAVPPTSTVPEPAQSSGSGHGFANLGGGFQQ